MAGGGSSGTALGVSVGSRCYVPDAQRMWLPAVVEDVDEHKRTVTVRLEPLDGDESSGDSGDGERRVVTVADGTVLPLQNAAPQLGGCDDMIELNHLHEAAILYNLKRRFHARRPYTYTGDICVALNPYQWLDELYSPELHTQYLRASSRRELPPHVYAVARAALGLEREGDSDDAPPPRFAYVREDASLAAKDRKNLAKTKHALALLGLAPHAQDALFQGIAGILHLGEAAFGARADNEDASRLEPDSVAYSSVLLGLEPDAMDRALCSRTMKAGGEVYAVPLSAAQATSGRDALAKALYARIFDWMVARYRTSKAVVEFARLSRTQFTVHHYADSVQYEAQGFLEKHKDALSPDLSELMRGSAERFLRELFETGAAGAATDEPPPGPPSRKRFAIFLSDAERERCDAVASCAALVRQFALQTPAEFQMGATKIYLQKGVLERLEHARAAKLFAFAARIQSAWRGLCARRWYDALRCALVVLQRRAKVFVATRRFQRTRAAAALVQRVWRGHVGRMAFFAVLCEYRALQIQRVWRGHAGRRVFAAVLRADRAVRIQCAFRRCLARRELARRRSAHAREQARLRELEKQRRELEKQRRAEDARLQRLAEEESAVTIQRLARGFLARSAFAKLVAQAAAETQRLQRLAEEEERERLRLEAEAAEREEQRRREAEEREAQRRREEEEREAQRLLALQREEEERARQLEAERQREAEAQEQAAVTVQKLTRGRLARQQFAVLRVEAARENATNAELLAAHAENARLRKQLEEILEANLELESLVTEWTCEREVLDASNHVKELELRQRISAKKQQLAAAHAEYTSLAEQLGSKNRSRSATETVDSNGSTETETLSSASERDDDDDDDDEDWAEHPHHDGDLEDFDTDRPSTDVSRLLDERARKSAAPRFSNAMKQPKEKSSQLLRAGASKFGLAKKWVNSAAAARRTGRATKVHGEADADSPVVQTKSGERGVAL
ncbi:hypothetical protein PybrP1_009982 [[Pythium] brassicae (nom. inval.)]|nr:hypothetical protein PybrP1_009982 [[Pythium] brassicae (nom. inval.)]